MRGRERQRLFEIRHLVREPHRGDHGVADEGGLQDRVLVTGDSAGLAICLAESEVH